MTEYEKLYRKMEIVANADITNIDTLKDMSDLLFSWNREEPDNDLPYKPATNVLEKLSRALEIIVENQEIKK